MTARPRRRPARAGALLRLALLTLAVSAPLPGHAQAAHPDAGRPPSLHRKLNAQAAQIRDLRRQLRSLASQVADLRRQAGGAAPRTLPRTPPGQTDAYGLILAGDYAAAAGAAAVRLSRNAGDPEALALRAYALACAGHPAAAGPLAVRALAATEGQTGRARALALLAQCALAAPGSDWKRTVQTYQQAGNDDLTLGLSYLAFADLLHRHGKDDLAKKLLQGALTQPLTPAESAAIRQALAAL